MTSTPKILIVDDEPLMCNSLRELMLIQGYQCVIATCGQEAKEKLSDHTFDLALLDMNLPDTDGHQLMDHIRAMSPDTLTIIITGNTSMDSVIGALKRGAHDYVQKPIEYEYLIKIIRNALDQKKLKSENKIINEKLKSSEERYRSLVQNSPDIIYTLDKDGNFTFISSAVETLLGYTPESLIGRHYTSIIHEDDLEKAQGLFNERQNGKPPTSGIELCLKMTKEKEKLSQFDDLVVELKWSAMYEKTGNGNRKKYIGTHGVARDISQKKSLETKLLTAQKMEAIGTLAGGIAHDFNNLLMGVQGYTSIMLMEMSPDHPHFEKLKSVEQYVQKGAELTKQLLGFARGGNFDIKTICINDLIRDVSRMFGRTKKEIIIHEEFSHDLLPVKADAGQLEQVLLNLFLNASNAMPHGGTLKLETKNVFLNDSVVKPYDIKKGNYVMASISDNGIGMDEKTLQRIFEPFFTTNKTGNGTGLGLASAYGIIHKHNGFFDVESKKGEGTSFRFFLPVSNGHVQKETPTRIKIEKGPETVLLVDDEKMIIEVGEEILKALGYEVMVAQNGEEAVNTYKRRKDQIDVIVLDMIMPGMGGGETFDRLLEVDNDVKVLLSSGYSIDGMATDIVKRGCKQFIQKPFDITELSRKLRDVLDQG